MIKYKNMPFEEEVWKKIKKMSKLSGVRMEVLVPGLINAALKIAKQDLFKVIRIKKKEG